MTLNRLAITHSVAEASGLGAIVLENGPLAIRKRLKPVLEAGREARLLRFDSSEQAYRSFFGLVVRDVQIRLLLGEAIHPTDAEIARDAAQATEQFLEIYGCGPYSCPPTGVIPREGGNPCGAENQTEVPAFAGMTR